MQGKNADEEAGALPVPEVDAESPSESPTNHPVDEVSADEAVIQSIADTEITVTVGEPIPLPDVVAVTYTDGRNADLPVVWERIAEEQLASPGTFALQGTLKGKDLKVAATIKVVAKAE